MKTEQPLWGRGIMVSPQHFQQQVAYGLPDMTKILQGMPGTAHELMGTLSAVLLKYEPRLKKIDVVLLEQDVPGELRYAIDAELKGVGLVRYGTEFMPEGRVLLRHLRQQQYLDTSTRI